MQQDTHKCRNKYLFCFYMHSTSCLLQRSHSFCYSFSIDVFLEELRKKNVGFLFVCFFNSLTAEFHLRSTSLPPPVSPFTLTTQPSLQRFVLKPTWLGDALHPKGPEGSVPPPSHLQSLHRPELALGTASQQLPHPASPAAAPRRPASTPAERIPRGVSLPAPSSAEPQGNNAGTDTEQHLL